jgi:hypothetical protein
LRETAARTFCRPGPFGRRREPHEDEAARPPARVRRPFFRLGYFAVRADAGHSKTARIGRRFPPRRRSSSAWVVVSDDSSSWISSLTGDHPMGVAACGKICSIHPGLAWLGLTLASENMPRPAVALLRHSLSRPDPNLPLSSNALLSPHRQLEADVKRNSPTCRRHHVTFSQTASLSTSLREVDSIRKILH